MGLLSRLAVRIKAFFAALFGGGAEAQAAAGANVGAEAAEGSASRTSVTTGAGSSTGGTAKTGFSTAISAKRPGEGSVFLARIAAAFSHMLGSLGISGRAGAAAGAAANASVNAPVGTDAAAGAQVQTAADAALAVSGD